MKRYRLVREDIFENMLTDLGKLEILNSNGFYCDEDEIEQAKSEVKYFINEYKYIEVENYID